MWGESVQPVWRTAAVAALIAGAVGVVAGCGSAPAAGGSSRPFRGTVQHPARADVTVQKCGVPSDGFAGPQATVRVLNHSSKRSDYIISVAFESPDGQTQLDTSLTTVHDLEPHQQAFGDAPSLNTDLRTAQFRCRVQDVVRTSAVG